MYWDEDAGGSPDASLAAYLAEGADDVAGVLRDLDTLLATDANLAGAARILGMQWDVTAFGMTYGEFFEGLRDALRQAARTP
jgi:hypothetical protein